MFVKNGDGKILSVVETDELTDEQKKIAKDLTKKIIKQSDETADSKKEAGR